MSRPKREYRWDDTQCLGCGYDLRGLRDSRNCPECGLAFDPSMIVVDAWSHGDWPRLWNLPFYGIVLVCSLATLYISRFVVVPKARLILSAISLIGVAGMLMSIWPFWKRWRGGASGRFLLYPDIAVFRKGPHDTVLRLQNLRRIRVRRRNRRHWRITLHARGVLIDVVVPADKRRIAALRSALKRRMGHHGNTGWGTRSRSIKHIRAAAMKQ